MNFVNKYITHYKAKINNENSAYFAYRKHSINRIYENDRAAHVPHAHSWEMHHDDGLIYNEAKDKTRARGRKRNQGSRRWVSRTRVPCTARVRQKSKFSSS